MNLRTRNVAVATTILAIGVPTIGIAATGSPLLEGKRNGTTTVETEIISNVGSTNTPKGGYSTRQSNLSNSGGGAVYGCRSTAGGSAANPPKNPCLRANNLSTGFAFEFNATSGPIVGLISVSGRGGDNVKPFITNATGVATGLNADRVDGQDAAAIQKAAVDAAAADATAKANAAKERWVMINQDGNIVRQSGGFKTVDCYRTNANCYIDAGEDVTNNSITTEIVTTNTPATDAGDTGPGPLTGESSSAPCFLDIVNCGPAGTDVNNGGNAGVFVVAPRESDGTVVDAGENRFTFYAKISAAENVMP